MLTKKRSNYKITEDLLKEISKHLSSRLEYRDSEYTVTIYKHRSEFREDVYWLKLKIEPNAFVFPNIHNRKEADRQTLLEHILIKHFYDLIDNKTSDGKYLLNPDSLIIGEYRFAYPIGSNRRKWFKV